MSAKGSKVPLNIAAATVEPGLIIDDRFCVVGPPTSTGDLWSIPVTDLQRQYGQAPHHRVTLHKVSDNHDQEHRIRVAVRADRQVQPTMHEIRYLFDGLMVVADTVPGHPLPAILRRHEAHEIARQAAILLSRLHGTGIRGVRFSRDQFLSDGGSFRLRSYEHLNASGSVESDLSAVTNFIVSLCADLHELITPEPATATELAQRLVATTTTSSWTRVLPPIAPYITPHEVIEDIFDSFVDARCGSAAKVNIRAPRGYGKTRLLHEIASEFSKREEAIVILAETSPSSGDGTSFIADIYQQLLRECLTCDAASADAIRRALRRKIKSSNAPIRAISPALARWLGFPPDEEPAPNDTAGAFTYQAQTLAECLRVVGTRVRPLLLLVDDIHETDTTAATLLAQLLDAREHHTLLITAGLLTGSRSTDQYHQLHKLTSEQIMELLMRCLPGGLNSLGAVADALLEATNGHPLTCWAVLQDWINSGLLRNENGAWTLKRQHGHAPVKPEDLYKRRLENLDADARTLVLCVAIYQGPLTVQELNEMLGWNDERTSRAVAVAVSDAVLQPLEGFLGFNHQLIREVIVASTSEDVVHDMHARIAHWLGKHPRPNRTSLAYHLEIATEKGVVERLGTLHVQVAGECLEQFDLVRAQWFSERSLQRSSTAHNRKAASLILGHVRALQDDETGALAHFAEALEYAQNEGDRFELASVFCTTLIGQGNGQGAARAATIALAGTRFSMRGKFHTLAKTIKSLVLLTVHSPIRLSGHASNAFIDLCARLGPVLLTNPVLMMFFLVHGMRVGLHRSSSRLPVVLSFWSAVVETFGMRTLAARLRARATELSDKYKDTWTRSVVLHVEAHCDALPSGYYKRGQALLEEAIQNLRLSRNLIWFPLSTMFQCFYGRDCEDTDWLAQRLDAALEVSRRHRQTVALHPLRALRLLCETRAANPSTKELQDAAKELEYDLRVLTHIIPADRFLTWVIVAETWISLEDAKNASRAMKFAKASIPPGPKIEIFRETEIVGAKYLLAFGTNSQASLARKRVARLLKIARKYPRHGLWAQLLNKAFRLRNVKAQSHKWLQPGFGYSSPNRVSAKWLERVNRQAQ